MSCKKLEPRGNIKYFTFEEFDEFLNSDFCTFGFPTEADNLSKKATYLLKEGYFEYARFADKVYFVKKPLIEMYENFKNSPPKVF